MVESTENFQTVPFPRLRRLIADSGRFASRKHNIRCLFEADVTNARKAIRDHKIRTGETLSFTAFVIACLGQAVETDRSIQAYRNWRNQLIIFDDVDVLTYIEIEVDGQRFPLAHVVRAVNRKSWREIHEEIRGVQANAGETPNARRRESAEWFLLLPAFARNVIYRIVNRSPRIWKKYVGTVYLTAVGMFGTGGGWGIGFSAHTLGVIIGGICEKPVAVKGRVEIRECLNLTADFDHDLTDGAPAARFIDKFKEFLERDIRSTILG